MKILIVLPGGVHPSGEIKVIPALLSLCEVLAKEHEVYIVALHQHDKLTEYRLRNCQVISLPYLRLRKMISSYRLVLTRLENFNFKPDIVHSFWLGAPTLLGALLAWKLKTPLLASIGGGELVSFPKIGYGGAQQYLSRFITKCSLKMANLSSCGSQFLQSIVYEQTGIRPNLVPLGIDTEFWSIKEMVRENEESWNLLQLASINKVKDPWLMLEIVQCLQSAGFQFCMNWVGEDTLNGEIQLLARKMRLDNLIHFHGFRTQAEIKKLLPLQDFVIQTSHFESQGIAIAEASSQGVCPVGTNVGWLKDLELGENGPRDVLAAKIADRILTLSEDVDTRKNRVLKAREWIKENSVQSTVKCFMASYKELLS